MGFMLLQSFISSFYETINQNKGKEWENARPLKMLW